MNIYSIDDQMERFGISKEEAENKIKNIKSVNVFSIDWQMNKFDISEEEAIEKIENIKNKIKESQSKMSKFDFNSMVPSKKEHWIKKGYSEEDSIVKANENIKIAKKNCSSFSTDLKQNPDKYKGVMSTQIEYYLKMGYSEDESKRLLKERQSTFSLEKCVKKYGIEEGYKRWKMRQDKWIKSIEGKITNDMRDSHSFKHFLEKNSGDKDKAISEQMDVFKKRYANSKFGKASKESMRLFKYIIERCESKNLKYYCGYEDNQEFYLFDENSKKVYAYDFTIPKLNLIIEFHGSFWHTKLPTDSINSRGVSMLDSYNKDNIKRDLAIRNGFKVLEIYEEDGFEFNFKKVGDLVNTIT